MLGVMGLQISLFGVMPNMGSDQWQLILDLSSPHGSSVNDGIGKKRYSLAYRLPLEMQWNKQCLWLICCRLEL